MLLQELTGGQGSEEEGQRLALPGLGGDQEEDEDLEHELDAVLQGDAVMGKYTKVRLLLVVDASHALCPPCECSPYACPRKVGLYLLGEGDAVGIPGGF